MTDPGNQNVIFSNLLDIFPWAMTVRLSNYFICAFFLTDGFFAAIEPWNWL